MIIFGVSTDSTTVALLWGWKSLYPKFIRVSVDKAKDGDPLRVLYEVQFSASSVSV